MAIVKPSRLGPDHVADAAPRLHEVVDVAPPGHQPPRRTFRARRPVPSVRGGWRSRSRRRPDGGANPGALFRITGNRRWPHVAPWNTQTVPILQQPDPRKLRKCSEFLDSGEWAIQDSNLGPLPYQENLLSPPVPPTRNLIPANRRDGAGGRGLEGTGRTSWWPHRGPTTAVRGQGVVWPGSGHHADDTVKPGRSGGAPLRACMIASTAASLGAWSSSSITWP